MENYNIRAAHGKKKGKFIPNKRKVWRENVRAAKLKKVENGVKTSCVSDGTFMFEPKTLSQKLWCKKCNKNVFLQDIIDVDSLGLAAIFKIMCNNCKSYVNVHTCEYRTSETGHKDFYINLKLAVALIDAGIGEAQINCVLSALNIPTISSYMVNKCNRVVGPKIESFAAETCIQSIREERQRTLDTVNNSISTDACDVESSLSSSLHNEDDDANMLVIDEHITDVEYESAFKNSVELEMLDKLGSIKMTDGDDDEITQTTDDDDDTNIQTIENSETADEDDDSTTVCNETDREITDEDGSDDDNRRNIHLEDSIANKNKKIGLIASFDAAWQTRGTGRSYNSLTGHSSLIGHYTGKVLSYAVRSKRCAMCEKGHKKHTHDCRHNFNRSAKAMEPDMAVQLVSKNQLLNDQNVFISVLIGDDDASSIAAVRNEVNYDIKKWSDMNHAKKNLVKNLFSLSMSRKLIDYFSRAFTYAIQQNKDDVTKTKAAIINIIDHAYGEHTNCGSWCRSFDDSTKMYVHRGLPYGKPLTDLILKEKLTALFDKYANNAEKLAPCGSSQRNESFNHLVCSKHPKNKFYGASESLHFRVAAAVAQKNFGSSYIIKVYEKLGISSGRYMTAHRQRKDRERCRKVAKSQTTAFKQNRLSNKKQRSQKKAAATNREGITYESGYGLADPSQIIDRSVSLVPVIDADEAEQKNIKLVYFDLETNSRSTKNAEICQISAIWNSTQFNAYIVPTYMSEGAREITKLSVNNGKLYLAGESGDKELETISPSSALLQFKQYLQSIGNDIILIAHNGFRFDVPIILRYIKQYDNIEEFSRIIFGFADTFPLLKEHLKERTKEKKSFSLESLISDFFGPLATEGCHNALVDVENLKKITELVNLPEKLIMKRSQSIQFILHREQQKLHTTNIKKSLVNLEPEIKAGMLDKIARAGVTWEMLLKVIHDNGERGIKILFMEDIGGRPRITKKSSIIASVIEKLKHFQ